MLAAIVGMASAGLAATHPDGKRGRAVDWIGFILLATFMVALVFGLHALPEARAAPLPAVGPLALAAAAFVLLLSVEARVEEPLVDLNFFSRRDFVMGLAIGSLSMFSIMSLLLYFNLYAQSPADWVSPPWRRALRCCRSAPLCWRLRCWLPPSWRELDCATPRRAAWL